MKIRLTCNLGLLVVCLLSLTATSVLAQDPKVREDVSRSFEKFELAKPTLTRSEGSVEKLQLTAAGRRLELNVWRNEMLAADYRAENDTTVGLVPMERPDVPTYRGVIAGADRSEVRLTIEGDTVEGFFDLGSVRYFIEPAGRFSEFAAADQVVVYQEEDVRGGNTFYCASDMPQRIRVQETALLQNEPQAALLAARNLEVATDADFEYVTRLGGASQANNNIVSILNMVEGTYASEINLEITITYQHTWSSADPLGGSNSSDVLNNFLSHWNQNFPRSQYPRDTAHLFSGKSYVLSAGIAYVGAICYTPQYAYGVSGFVSWAPGKYLIPAHEIGHNLGAEHAETAQGCGSTIMNAFLSGSAILTFCPYSRNEIGTFISQNGSCLLNGAGGGTPTPTPTPTPFPTPTPTPFPTPTPTPFPTPTPTPFPTPTPTPFPTPTPTPFPTPTATPTPTPTPVPTPFPGIRPRFDFDGDGQADFVVFRPSNGRWYMNLTGSGFYEQNFGQNGDRPVSADYDGDRKSDPAVYRNGVWYRVRSSANTYDVVNFGVAGDVPAPADFDGDNRADVAVFRPSTGEWYRQLTGGGGFSVVNFGVNGDVPMAQDFDGDRRADIGVFRPSNGTWYRLNSTGTFAVHQFGVDGDKPVQGDFDGDGRADLAVWRPSNGTWYFLGANTYTFAAFGVSGDIPAPADFDGDGKTDIAVFRPSNGTWYRIDSGAQAYRVVQYGQPADIPATSYYVQ